jgi:hypothetical protein
MISYEHSADYGDHKRARRAEFILTLSLAAFVIIIGCCWLLLVG